MVKRHNQAEIDARKKIGVPKRYVFNRSEVEGRPTLKIEDHYLAPHVINTYEFAYLGKEYQYDYAAHFIENLIKRLNLVNEPLPSGGLTNYTPTVRDNDTK